MYKVQFFIMETGNTKVRQVLRINTFTLCYLFNINARLNLRMKLHFLVDPKTQLFLFSSKKMERSTIIFKLIKFDK